jgi:outer membrane protein assembly factor BamB
MRNCFRLLVALAILVIPALLHAADWPQWRGPRRDGVSLETGLLQSWPTAGPKLLWTCKQAGYGLSSMAVVGDTLYTCGVRGDDEYVLAFEVASGKEKWNAKIGKMFTFRANVWGDGPRATPTVDGDRVYAYGGQGDLVCVERDTGKVVWRKTNDGDFKGQIMVYTVNGLSWGFAASPLIDGDVLVFCPGGPDGWMAALDKKTGAVNWRTKDVPDQAPYASTVVADIGGVRQYIGYSFQGVNGGGLRGVDAKTGKMLWYVHNDKFKDVAAICSTPIVKDNLVYVSINQNVGCYLYEITKDNAGQFHAKDLYDPQAQKLMQNHHCGVVLVGDYLYGYSDTLGFLCQDFKTGKEKWAERNKIDGKCAVSSADGYLYLLTEEGEAVLLRASPADWEEHGRFSLPALSTSRQTRPTHAQTKSWVHPVVANGRLYLRDQEFIYCYHVRAQ